MTRLVPNASPLVAGLDASIAAAFALPIDRITDFWSPERCPLELLGYLAWQLSIDLWDDAWPELKKRQVCASAFNLHRSKTTLAGIRAHVALVGSTVDRAIRPPARGFLRGAMTDAQRAAWLEDLPQVRLYPFAHAAVAVRRTFVSGPAARFYQGAGFLRAGRAPLLVGLRATYYDRGAEHDITHRPVGDGIQFFLSGSGPLDWCGAAFAGHAFARNSRAAGAIVSVRLSDDVAGFAIEAGLDPVDVRPVRVAQPRVAPRARAFLGRSGQTFLRSSYAPFLIYDKVSLHDPARLGARRRTRSFVGRGRFGIAPFTAELRIDVPMRRAPRRAGRWLGAGFIQAPDFTPLARTLEAIRISKAHRDTILVDTTTRRSVRFGDAGLRFGEFDFGSIRKVA